MNAVITTRALSCGMPLVCEVLSGVRSAGVCWMLPCGPAQDPPGLDGLSAMWNEMLPRGAGSRSSREFADALDALGVGRSVAAGTFALAIGATMLGTRLDAALPMLVDMVLRPRMDEQGIEPARDLCLQAIESLKDDPRERAVLGARARHLPDPINRSGLGSPAGLQAITRDDLVGRWKGVARPGGSVLGVAGAIDPAAVASRLEALLEGWTGRAVEPATAGSPVRGYAHETDQSNQVQIIVMHDAPVDGPERDGVESRDALLERVVTAVLSGGMSGRLFTEVREKRGLCYAVQAGYRGDRTYGTVSAYVGTTPERAQESLDVLLAELDRINTPAGRVTPEEFQRALVGFKSGLVFSGESTSARASALAGDTRRLGRARSLGEIADRLDSITLDEVNAYLARRTLGTLTIQTLGPAALRAPKR